MKALAIDWLILSVSFWGVATLLPGMRLKRGVLNTLLVAALFGVLNKFLGGLIFAGLGVATLGLGFLLAFITRIVADTIVLKITDAFTDRLTITSWRTALVAAILISALGTAGEWAQRHLM